MHGDEFELFSKMFHIIEASLPKPSLLAFLHFSPEKLLENIAQRGREYEQKIQADYLREVEQSYFNFIRQHRDLRVVIIDTNDVDFVNNAEHYERMKAILNDSYPKGVSLVKA